MVIKIAITPSLKASRRFLFIAAHDTSSLGA